MKDARKTDMYGRTACPMPVGKGWIRYGATNVHRIDTLPLTAEN